jgi:hypothetical protein
MIATFGVANGNGRPIMMAIEKQQAGCKVCCRSRVLTLPEPGRAAVDSWGSMEWAGTPIAICPSAFLAKICPQSARVLIRTQVWDDGWKITGCSLPYAALLAITDNSLARRQLHLVFAQILAVLPVFVICVSMSSAVRCALFRSGRLQDRAGLIEISTQMSCCYCLP